MTGRLAVCRLAPDAPFPELVRASSLLAFIQTTDELCVVCDEVNVPRNVTVEKGWRVLRVLGPLAFSQVGVLASLAEPLSEAGVSIFVISTYDTDYILIKDSQIKLAVRTLRKAGHQVVME